MVKSGVFISVDNDLLPFVNELSSKKELSGFVSSLLRKNADPKFKASMLLEKLNNNIKELKEFDFLRVDFKVYNLNNENDVKVYNRFIEILNKGLQYETEIEKKDVINDRILFNIPIIEKKESEVILNG